LLGVQSQEEPTWNATELVQHT